MEQDEQKQKYQKRNMHGFYVHAIFLALTMNFIDINTVIPNMLAQAGATSVHLGLLSAIMIGGTGFMQLPFAGLIIPLRRKKPALLAGIYLRVSALLVLGLFLQTLSSGSGSGSMGKVWIILLCMAVFSFSGAFANISYTDILGRVILPENRKRLLTDKQLIASIGVIASAVIVKAILSSVPYPDNYSTLFLLSALLLTLATIGFWMLKESDAPVVAAESFLARVKMFWTVLRTDRNMVRYLLLLNTSGVFLSTIPFFILFARDRIAVDGSLAATFLLTQMGGSLAANLLLKAFSHDQRYRPMLYLFIAIGSITTFLALLLPPAAAWYATLFFFCGAATTLYKIAIPGVLLEISNDANRSVYTALAGSGSIMNVLYPILAGLLAKVIGLTAVLAITGAYILLGIPAARKLVCARIGR
jgi:MFS family permease